MADPVFRPATSPSPRRDTERTPARRRAASVQCSRMLRHLLASAEAVRLQHERLLRASETRPFNTTLPDPVVLALHNLPTPAADDTAALAAATTSAVPAAPGPSCDPSAVPLLHDSDAEAELMDTTATRKRLRPSESSDDEGCSRKVPAIAAEVPQCSPPTPHLRPLIQSKAQRRRERKAAAAVSAARLSTGAGTEASTVPPSTAANATPAVATTTAPQLTVLFRPTGAGAVFPRTARLSLAKALSALAGIRDVRVSTKKTVVAADAVTVEWRERLLAITELAGIPGILGENPEEELLAGLESEVPVLGGRSQGTALILDFAASVPPARVRLFRMAHQARACRPRPLQCERCGSYGHVTATCSRPQRCLRCGGGPHGDSPCAVKARCIHCGQAHAATSPNCQLWQTERHLATIKATAPTFIPHREAMGALRQPPAAPPVPPPTCHPGGLSYGQAARPVQKGARKPPAKQQAPPQQPEDQERAHLRLRTKTVAYKPCRS
ncbi:hypothetical protein HPB50_016787 [Hyalomma asiaticum]|uniref:Uncharacterized protein n=1 Tax=Hyalomma asiaticum TaxID=266040 RepID=A0ACB7S0L3_HYAAI|nr:hypothetical protein HPB50_016787 [Hyalomma asiaticum]